MNRRPAGKPVLTGILGPLGAKLNPKGESFRATGRVLPMSQPCSKSRRALRVRALDWRAAGIRRRAADTPQRFSFAS